MSEDFVKTIAYWDVTPSGQKSDNVSAGLSTSLFIVYWRQKQEGLFLSLIQGIPLCYILMVYC